MLCIILVDMLLIELYFCFLEILGGIPENAVDIALLAGTTTGAPYNPLTALQASNSSATISDQR